MLPVQVLHHSRAQAHRTWSVTPDTLDGAGAHLLKPNNQYTIHSTIPHQRPRHMQTRAACRTCIVRVVYWNSAHTKLVEDALAGSGVTVAVAGDTGLDVIVGYASVEHGFDASFVAKFRIITGAAWLEEFCEADAYDVGGYCAAGSHLWW